MLPLFIGFVTAGIPLGVGVGGACRASGVAVSCTAVAVAGVSTRNDGPSSHDWFSSGDRLLSGEAFSVDAAMGVSTAATGVGVNVGGKVGVNDEISAKNIEVGGVLRSRKATAEECIEVGGSIISVEGVTARCVEIGRRGKVRGPIKADRVVIGRDAHAEDIYGKQVLLRRGAQAENVYGENITIESGCHICGEVQYTRELRMDEHVSLAKEPQKVDTLPS